MKQQRIVSIGLLGTTLDACSESKENRWSKWRPTVSLCQHEDLLVHRFELLYEPRYEKLANQTRADIAMVSPETEIRLWPIAPKDWWDFADVYAVLFDFARGYSFDTEKEDYLIHITTGSHVAQICLFLLTEARWLPGKLLQSEPPHNKRSEIGSYKIIDLDLSQYDEIASRFMQSQKEGVSYLKHGINTRNAAFNTLIERIEEVAVRSKDPILLTGPTGAGKSQLARRIFDLKKSRQLIKGDFVEVNSATLRGDQAMSALFGHVKGAFTGATGDRPGLLRKAHDGILFLDEIGDLNLDEQAMLLRALEEKRFLPVGADTEACSDFQLIAGTNHDLLADIRTDKFRDDLLARINLWTFQLPGLSQRVEDIEPNLEYELDQFAHSNGQHVTFSKEAKEQFLQFAISREALWKSNFRDLNGAIRRLSTLSQGGRISRELVSEEIERLRRMWGNNDRQENDEFLLGILGEKEYSKIDRFGLVQLKDVVAVCRSSRSLSEAGRVLFPISRQQKQNSNDADRLRKYLLWFGFTWQQIQDSAE